MYFKTELVLEKGDKLFLSGNIPELGCWKEEYAIEATPVEPYSEGLHLVIIKLPMHRPIRWKWAIANEGMYWLLLKFPQLRRIASLRVISVNSHVHHSCVEKLEKLSRPFTISDQYSFQILLCQMDISTFS